MNQESVISFNAAGPHNHVSGIANLSFAMSALMSGAQHGEHAMQGGIDLVRKSVPVNEAAVAMTRSATSFLQDPKSKVFKDGQAVHSATIRVGLLEDCQIEAEGIIRLFEENSYKVVKCSSGADFLKMLASETFDMLVLDWNVPDISGFDVLYKIREGMQLTTPVLMLTSRASEYDVVQALNRGADDYLHKPWKPFELIARVNALLRRQMYIERQQDERHLDFVLEPKLSMVTRNGMAVRLSHKEFLLFQLLIRHLGSPLSRAHIVQTLWHDEDVEARTLDVHISRLRTKLGLTIANGFNLTSIYGYGYRFEKLGHDGKRIE